MQNGIVNTILQVMDHQRRRLQTKIDRAYDNAYRLGKGNRARYWFRQAVKLERKLHGNHVVHFIDLSYSESEARRQQTKQDLELMLRLANETFGVPQKFMAINLELMPEKNRYVVALKSLA